MIRDWENEDKWIKVVKDKDGKGKKRKRVDGVDAELDYSVWMIASSNGIRLSGKFVQLKYW